MDTSEIQASTSSQGSRQEPVSIPPFHQSDRTDSNTSERRNSRARRSPPLSRRNPISTSSGSIRQRFPNTDESSLRGQDESADGKDAVQMSVLEPHQVTTAHQHHKTVGDEVAALRFRQLDIRDDTRSVLSESTVLPRKDLKAFDVAALILNKQIGTGIFTTPGLVLALTGSKTISLVMWFLGGVWAFISVVIYVEFGAAFPFNGGELIYLDEVARRPELLSAMLFSAFFIFIPNTDGNSLQFAKHVLLAAIPTAQNTEELDRRLICLIAVCVLTVVSFIHYFSRHAGLLLNMLFAIYKVTLLIVFIIAGGIASRNPDYNGRSDWGTQAVAYKNPLAAMIYIIYSYQGWENANYVGGEVKVAKNDLRWGAFFAVFVCTLLYTLTTLVYSLVCPFGDLIGQDLGIVSHFATMVFGSTGAFAIKICISLSAFGNLVAVIYTSARVKQQIARQCIIPFFKFFSKEDRQFGSPGPALILHWLAAFVWILCTPNTSDGYSFVIGLFIYGQLVVGVCVGVAFFNIRRNYEADKTRTSNSEGTDATWTPVVLKKRWVRHLAGAVFIGMNSMVIVAGAMKSKPDPRPGQPVPIPAWLKPTILFSWLGFAACCWAVLRIIEHYSSENWPVEIRIVREGQKTVKDEDKAALKQATQEGNVRIVVYELHGQLDRTVEWLGDLGTAVLKLLLR